MQKQVVKSAIKKLGIAFSSIKFAGTISCLESNTNRYTNSVGAHGCRVVAFHYLNGKLCNISDNAPIYIDGQNVREAALLPKTGYIIQIVEFFNEDIIMSKRTTVHKQ